MPKSIIEVEIDPEGNFKRFKELFDKYRDELGKLGAKWGESTEQIEAIAAGMAGVTSAMEAQAVLAKKEADAKKAEAKAAKEKLDAEKKEAEAEKQAAARRKKAIEDTKQIARNVRDTAVDLAKWAAIGEGASMVAGGLGFWGLDRMVAGVGQERRLAQGLGVTTGQRQAMSVNMERYFDVNSALENVAEAKADPSKRWVFTGMGVQNPMSKDPAQLAMESAIAARRVFMAGGQNELWAKSHGLLDIFSMDELRRLAATPEDQLRRSEGQAQRDAAPGGRFFLADDVSLKWQNFTTQLEGATLALKLKFIDKLTVLEPDLERIMSKFTDLAVKVLDRIDFDKLGGALDKFTSYVTSPKFESDIKTFVDDVSYAANKMVHVLEMLGLIPDSPPPRMVPGPNGKPVPTPPMRPGDPNPLRDPSTRPGGYYTWDLFGNPHWHKAEKPMLGEHPFHTVMRGMDPTHGQAIPAMRGMDSTHNQTVPALVGGVWAAIGKITQGHHTTGLPNADQARAPLASISAAYGLVPGLLSAIYKKESTSGVNAGYSHPAHGPPALGPFQFVPATAAQYGVNNRMRFGDSAEGAAKYFQHLLNTFHGNTEEAVAAYNWGEGRVQRDIRKNHGDWLRHAPHETQDYVQKVMAYIRADKSARPQAVKVEVNMHNQTGASVATSVNAASR